MKPKHPLRWIIPIAYVVSLDGCVALFLVGAFFELEESNAFETAVVALMGIGGILLIASIVECIVLHAVNAPYRQTFSRRIMLLTKVGLVPFFCLYGFALAILIVGSTDPLLATTSRLSIFAAVLIGWTAMMGGSAWAIAYAFSLYREKLMCAGEFVVHTLLQLIFFADFFDALVLFAVGRAREALSKRISFAQPVRP
ncbi:hypothetical protein [Raoultibacter phocaeensis]|uniref:hypothetical protein n=1 Tax=Raoultibacter phocaeensis TaxID=2479841 RepID=UPI0011189B2B|nr:hypothetical protein [Raoultibacter phocaeensis]